jgi:hypothetical protein
MKKRKRQQEISSTHCPAQKQLKKRYRAGPKKLQELTLINNSSFSNYGRQFVIETQSKIWTLNLAGDSRRITDWLV